MFQVIFSWSAPLSDLIEMGLNHFANLVKGIISEPLLQSLVVDGIITGAGYVFVFSTANYFIICFNFIFKKRGVKVTLLFLKRGIYVAVRRKQARFYTCRDYCYYRYFGSFGDIGSTTPGRPAGVSCDFRGSICFKCFLCCTTEVFIGSWILYQRLY